MKEIILGLFEKKNSSRKKWFKEFIGLTIEVGSVEPSEIANPHTLWKQVTGVVIASVIVFFFGGIFFVLTGVFTFIDAWKAGIYKIKDKKAFVNLSPMGWAIAMEGLSIITFPLYLVKRNKLKTKTGNVAFFVLIIVFATLGFAFAVLNLIAQGS